MEISNDENAEILGHFILPDGETVDTDCLFILLDSGDSTATATTTATTQQINSDLESENIIFVLDQDDEDGQTQQQEGEYLFVPEGYTQVTSGDGPHGDDDVFRRNLTFLQLREDMERGNTHPRVSLGPSPAGRELQMPTGQNSRSMVPYSPSMASRYEFLTSNIDTRTTNTPRTFHQLIATPIPILESTSVTSGYTFENTYQKNQYHQPMPFGAHPSQRSTQSTGYPIQNGNQTPGSGYGIPNRYQPPTGTSTLNQPPPTGYGTANRQPPITGNGTANLQPPTTCNGTANRKPPKTGNGTENRQSPTTGNSTASRKPPATNFGMHNRHQMAGYDTLTQLSSPGTPSQQQPATPGYGTSSQQQSSTPGIGTSSRQQSSTPDIGTSSRQQPSRLGNCTSSRQQPLAPVYGTSSWQQQSTPGIGTSSRQQPLAPGNGTSSWQQSSTPVYGTSSWQQPSTPGNGTSSRQQPLAPVYGTSSWQRPSTHGNGTSSRQQPSTPGYGSSNQQNSSTPGYGISNQQKPSTSNSAILNNHLLTPVSSRFQQPSASSNRQQTLTPRHGVLNQQKPSTPARGISNQQQGALQNYSGNVLSSMFGHSENLSPNAGLNLEPQASFGHSQEHGKCQSASAASKATSDFLAKVQCPLILGPSLTPVKVLEPNLKDRVIREMQVSSSWVSQIDDAPNFSLVKSLNQSSTITQDLPAPGRDPNFEIDGLSQFGSTSRNTQGSRISSLGTGPTSAKTSTTSSQVVGPTPSLVNERLALNIPPNVDISKLCGQNQPQSLSKASSPVGSFVPRIRDRRVEELSRNDRRTRSYLQAAISKKMEDEEINGNQTLQSLMKPFPEDFKLNLSITHWPLFPHCKPDIPCIHSIVQHDLPYRFFTRDLGRRLTKNLKWKYQLKKQGVFPHDASLNQGCPVGKTKLIKIGCPAIDRPDLPELTQCTPRTSNCQPKLHSQATATLAQPPAAHQAKPQDAFYSSKFTSETTVIGVHTNQPMLSPVVSSKDCPCEGSHPMKDTAALDLSKNTAVEVLMCLSEWRQFSETPFQSTPKNKNSLMKVQQSTDLSQESVIDNPENRTVSVSVPHSTSFEVRTSSKNPSSHQHIENPAIPISMSPPSNEIFPGFNLGNNDQNDDLFNTNKERNHDEASNGQTKTNMDQPPNSLLNINQNQHQTSSGLPNTSQNQSQSSNGLLNYNGDPNNPSRVNNSKEFNKMEWNELRRKEISECSCSTCGEDDSSCFETDEDSDSNDVEGEVTIIAERFHSKPTDNRLKMLGQPAKTRGRQPPGASLNRKTSKNLEATKTKRSYTKKNSLVQDTKCGNQKQDKESQPSCNKDSKAAKVITKSFETPQPRYATRFGSMKTEMKDKPIDLPANSNPLDVAAANKFDESSSNESFLPENPFTGSPTKKFKLFGQVPVKTYRKKKSSPSKSSRTFDKASSLQVDKKIKGTKKQVDPKKRDTSKSSMEHDSAKMTKHKLKASKNGAKIKPSPEVQIEKSKFQIEESTSVTVPNPSEAEPTTSMKTIEEEKNGSKWFDSLSGRDKCEKLEDLTRINDEIVQDVSPVKMTRIGQSIIFVADDGKVYGKEVCNNIEAKSKPSSNKDEITQNDGTDDQKMPSEDHFDEITNDSLLAEQTVNESTGAKSKPLLSLEETIPMVELAKIDGNNSEVKSIAKSHASSVATSLENPPNPTKRQSTEAMKSTPTKKIKSLDGTHDIGDSQQVSPGSLTKLGKTKSAAFVPKPCKIRTRSSYKKMDD